MKNLAARTARAGCVLGILLVFLALGFLVPGGRAQASHERTLRLATDTTPLIEGVLGVLLPAFESEANISVRVVSKNPGAVIRDGEEGLVDVLLIPAMERDEAFIAQGFGAYRLDVMTNSYILVGPASDPAAVAGTRSIVRAFEKIALSESRFVALGDDGGIHTLEQEIWRLSGRPLETSSHAWVIDGSLDSVLYQHPEDSATWYSSMRSDLDTVLLLAEKERAYTLTDRGTYLKYKVGRKESLKLQILQESDPLLTSRYAVIPVSPVRHPNVNFRDAESFAKWLAGPKAQELIRNYRFEGQAALKPGFPPQALNVFQ